MKKICICCQEEKSIGDFYRNHNYGEHRSCGYRQPCKQCTNTSRLPYNAGWRITGPGKESVKISNRLQYIKAVPARLYAAWVYRIKSWYGITPEDYAHLMALQNGVCALCGGQPYFQSTRASSRRLCIDHKHGHHEKQNHACKACIRGLLCDRCNRRVLPVLESFGHLQSEFVRAYLESRPLLGRDLKTAKAVADASLSEICK